ncbi:Superfamily II DNA and RNA helicase [Lampropedia hyalina DSM 16112]|jgi:superfamily II DNA/RNA helicase|uniref:Superfamily II DNA and RNA helicase n=1 Tax=Lampropedia hyalina DSM 16112 TaxID=1122156 RepID=A0A1M4TDA5_9BURK|nr:DEAD/DEAH box helicase [Lampropedia hyalina]SHE42529.1 Superfamily II DNA and RNA helicase [Lampropedia hyalina DSM 16112]
MTYIPSSTAEATSAVASSPAVDDHTPQTPSGADNAFAALGLAPELLQAVSDMGYTQPTPVQLRAIPLALQKADAQQSAHYVDLMVSSQTGSGKTAAFLLPVLHTLIEMDIKAKEQEKADFERGVAEALARGEEAPRKPRRKNPLNRKFTAAEPGALVLCPTRELAMQVANDAIDLIRHNRGIRIASVIGGLPYPKQIAQLQNARLVVATPGRLLDLQRSGQIKLEGVQFLVLDEADRMLDLGFAEDLEEISRLTEQRRQTMMFSATFAPRIQKLAMSVMHDNGRNAQKIEIASPQIKHENITQKLFWADTPEHKRQLLDAWLRSPEIDQAIVFASTQIECDELATDLHEAGFSAVALHGALGQGMRMRRLAALRDGRVQILVATDVAARGIDVPTITHVFNYGLPMKAEDYTHRIGRTGRAGREGLAVTFAEYRDRRRIFEIESFTRQKLQAVVWPGLEPRQSIPEWRNNGGGRGDGRDSRNSRHGGGRPGGNARSGHGGGYGQGQSAGRGSYQGGERGAGKPFGAPRGDSRSQDGREQQGGWRNDHSERREWEGQRPSRAPYTGASRGDQPAQRRSRGNAPSDYSGARNGADARPPRSGNRPANGKGFKSSGNAPQGARRQRDAHY